jgi:hypothetical protein
VTPFDRAVMDAMKYGTGIMFNGKHVPLEDFYRGAEEL